MFMKNGFQVLQSRFFEARRGGKTAKFDQIRPENNNKAGSSLIATRASSYKNHSNLPHPVSRTHPIPHRVWIKVQPWVQ